MTVRCHGDKWIMEQVGEKQDFESELSRVGLRHEDFVLYVRRAGFGGTNRQWSSNYAVRVTHLPTRKCNIYWGGPGENWVELFARDVGDGMYGEPSRRYETLAGAGTAPRSARRSLV